MQIESLELKDFRNYKEERFSFDAGTNVIYGDNAQGKTNLLEALEVCATTRSHRGNHDAELIRFGKEEAHLRIYFQKKGQRRKIDLHLRRNGKKGAAIDGIPIRRAAELYGQVNLVSFFPEDLAIIKNSPKERRRFLDSQLCQLDAIYVSRLAEYNKLIQQRNALLRDPRLLGARQATLDVLDEQLITAGTFLIKSRRQFLEEIGVFAGTIHAELTEGKETCQLVYEPNTTEETFAEDLRRNREKDLYRKTSSTGPHRDDFRVQSKGTDLRPFGSQGQQRSAALSLKLSEIELVKKRTGDTPILLLDDVLSELDRHRQNMLLKKIEHIQTFLTCTGMDELLEHAFPMDKVFRIEEGRHAAAT